MLWYILIPHFLLLNNIPLHKYTTFYFSFNSFDGHVGFFYFLAIMSNSAVKIHIQLFVWPYVFISPGYIFRNEIACSYGNSMFNISRNCQNCFSKQLHHFVFLAAM